MMSTLLIIMTVIKKTNCEDLYLDEPTDFSITVQDHFTGEAGLCIIASCFFTVPQNVTEPIKKTWIKGDPQNPSNEIPCFDIFYGVFGNELQCSFLLLNLVQGAFDGEYRLNLEWETGKMYLFAQTVRISVQELTRKPTIKVPELTEGEEAKISCKIPGDCEDPSADVAWTGIEPEMINLIGERIPGYATHFSVMTFHPESKHHKANLTCTVTFQGKIQTETTVVLEVRHAPTILNESHCYTWADELTCVCVSSGVPSPQINWPRLDGEYYSASSAENTISIITVSVASFTKLNTSIECVSENPLGSSKMKIQVQSRAGKHNGSWNVSTLWIFFTISLIINVIITSHLTLVLRRKEKYKKKNDNCIYMTVKREESMYDSIKASSKRF